MTSTPYAARDYYYDPEGDSVYVLKDRLFHEYIPTRNRVIWFQSTSTTHENLPASVIITTVLNFGSILVCRMPLSISQQHTNQDTQQEALLMISFADYLEIQPQHVRRMLGNLLEQDIDPDY
eukprot:15060853-Ditylum_brightwellii.AAC.1